MLKDYPYIKSIKWQGAEVELHPQPIVSQVQTVMPPVINDMPPDDVMLFAATEDVDDLMEKRSV